MEDDVIKLSNITSSKLWRSEVGCFFKNFITSWKTEYIKHSVSLESGFYKVRRYGILHTVPDSKIK